MVTIALGGPHAWPWITLNAIFLKSRHNARRLRVSSAWLLASGAARLVPKAERRDEKRFLCKQLAGTNVNRPM